MPYAAAGATNFFPFLDANLKVQYARNPKDFNLPKYVLMADCQKQQAYFTTINPSTNLRIVGSNQYESYWADGADRPSGVMNSVDSNYSPIRLYRHSHNFNHGAMGVQQATYDVMKDNAYAMAQKAMTMRTLWVRNALTASSIPSVSATTALGGSLTAIGSGTVANPVLLKLASYAANVIMKATGGVVRKGSLKLVFGPLIAQAIAASSELLAFIQQQAGSQKQMEDGWDSTWNIPERYRGFPLVCEDAVIEPSNIGATSTADYIWNDDDIFVLARIDKNGGSGMEGPAFRGEDGNIFPTQFSTGTLFEGPYISVNGSRDGTYGMATEAWVDTVHERFHGGVRDNFGFETTSTISGLRITDCIS